MVVRPSEPNWFDPHVNSLPRDVQAATACPTAATAARAREKGVFVVPMDGALRVALCAIPTSDIPRLVQVLAVAAEG